MDVVVNAMSEDHVVLVGVDQTAIVLYESLLRRCHRRSTWRDNASSESITRSIRAQFLSVDKISSNVIDIEFSPKFRDNLSSIFIKKAGRIASLSLEKRHFACL